MHGATWLLMILGLGACRGGPPAFEIPLGDNPLRWEAAVARFEEDDRRNPPARGGVVFLGSSSIRLWTSLKQDMAPLPVIQRGFGGSKLSDVIYFAERLVSVHEPSLVVVFCGTNDIARNKSKTAEEVRGLFHQLVQRLRWFDPDLTICHIAITPTRARLRRIATVNEANRLIRADCEADPRLEFIDAGSALLDEEGNPDPQWFRSDRLHLNAAGYAIWTEHIRPAVLSRYRDATGVDTSGW